MYIIRADGNAQIGAGHLMRCLTIADALLAEYATVEDILFVCDMEESAQLVRERGYECFVCHTDYRSMEAELPEMKRLLEQAEGPHTILVDSYFVSDFYLMQLRQWGQVAVLDDLQCHTFPADMVINYNAFAQKEIYERLYQGTTTRYAIGAQLVPLRPQFRKVRYQLREQVTDLLITTGGGDSDNIAEQILRTIYNEKIKFHLITGKFNPHLDRLKQWEAKGNVRVLYDVRDMAACMKACDVAITAGGTTIYELAAIGVPFICFSYAENQEALTEYVGQKAIAEYAGAYHKEVKSTLNKIRQQCEELIRSPQKRNMCYGRERAMVDGDGADRIARLLAGRM